MEVNQIKQLRIGDRFHSALTNHTYQVTEILGEENPRKGHYLKALRVDRYTSPGQTTGIPFHFTPLTFKDITLMCNSPLLSFLRDMKKEGEEPGCLRDFLGLKPTSETPLGLGLITHDTFLTIGDIIGFDGVKGEFEIISMPNLTKVNVQRIKDDLNSTKWNGVYTRPELIRVKSYLIKKSDFPHIDRFNGDGHTMNQAYIAGMKPMSEIPSVPAPGSNTPWSAAIIKPKAGDFIKNSAGSTFEVDHAYGDGSIAASNVATGKWIVIPRSDFNLFVHTPPPVTQHNPRITYSELRKYPLTKEETYYTPVLDAIRQSPITETKCHSKADQEACEKRIDPVYSSDKAADIATFLMASHHKMPKEALFGNDTKMPKVILHRDLPKEKIYDGERVDRNVMDEVGQFPRISEERKHSFESNTLKSAHLFYLTNICLAIMQNLEVRKMVLNKLNIKDPGTDANY